jgi:hypothetical protein
VTRRSERSSQKRCVRRAHYADGMSVDRSASGCLVEPSDRRSDHRVRPCIRVAAGWVASSRIDRQFDPADPPEGDRPRTARTGVLSSLPFSRSRSSGTHHLDGPKPGWRWCRWPLGRRNLP